MTKEDKMTDFQIETHNGKEFSESRYRFWKQDLQADELKKIRRRIEDALRKTATPGQLARIAEILGIKTG